MSTNFTASRNACKACTPLGAALAFAGVENAVCLLHGSQGCSTYIRRFLIGHFREPLDIASSNFHESAAIFGGRDNLFAALDNVIRQYHPALIGVATTCLAETIGDDVAALLLAYRTEHPGPDLPVFVPVSTPSYEGSHAEGFAATTRALVEALASDADERSAPPRVNLMPGMVSPADLRYLRDLVADFGLTPAILPDYADTLDGPAWGEYHLLPPGGAPLADFRHSATAVASLEFTSTLDPATTAAAYLEETFCRPRRRFDLPLGIATCDALTAALEDLSGRPLPPRHAAERGRLIDSYVDAHKYLFGKRAGLYGDEDLLVGLAKFLTEIGIEPVLMVTGGRSGRLKRVLDEALPQGERTVLDDSDFATMDEAADALELDLLIGGSDGYRLSSRLGIPLVRVGMPIHDRLGAARLMHVGYRGTQQLLDRVTNALMADEQDANPVGYTHL